MSFSQQQHCVVKTQALCRSTNDVSICTEAEGKFMFQLCILLSTTSAPPRWKPLCVTSLLISACHQVVFCLPSPREGSHTGLSTGLFYIRRLSLHCDHSEMSILISLLNCPVSLLFILFYSLPWPMQNIFSTLSLQRIQPDIYSKSNKSRWNKL